MCEAAGKRRPGAQERPEPAGAAAVAQLARSWVSLGLGSKRITRRAITSTYVSLAWSLPDSTNLSPVEVMAGRSFSPAQVRERASARRGPLRVTAPVGAARTGSARKSIAEGSDERPGSTGERRVRAPGLPKYLSTILDMFRSSCHGRLGVPLIKWRFSLNVSRPNAMNVRPEWARDRMARDALIA